MTSPVEVPLLREHADHAPTCAPEFSPSHPENPVNPVAIVPSTFAPPEVDKPVLDYETVMAELDRLQARIDALKIAVTR